MCAAFLLITNQKNIKNRIYACKTAHIKQPAAAPINETKIVANPGQL